MLKTILARSSSLYDILKDYWESKKCLYLISLVLVLVFIFASLLSVLVINNYVDIGAFNEPFENVFFSIEIVFTLLLITELIGLIFMLPKSVSKSVGKQFELLSLIFLRDGFKEFSHFGSNVSWVDIKDSLFNMSVYGFGAVVIFVILGFTYKLQQHIKITDKEDMQEKFITQKRVLALFLFLAFLVIGFIDIKELVTSGVYLHSFKAFYTVLIFSDIIIILIALRYSLNYYRIFRYSAFVLATIMIRISLSAKPVFDVAIGVVAALFVLFLTMAYNYFLKEELIKITHTKKADLEKP